MVLPYNLYMVIDQQLSRNEEDVQVSRGAEDVAKELSGRLAEDVLVLDVRGKSDFTDYFVIATGETARHLDYLAKGAKDALEEADFSSVKVEGHSEGGWVALDANVITVHLFTAEQRANYDLEGLWIEAVEVLRYDE